MLAAWESVVGIVQNAPPDHCVNGFWYGQRGHVGWTVSKTVADDHQTLLHREPNGCATVHQRVPAAGAVSLMVAGSSALTIRRAVS